MDGRRSMYCQLLAGLVHRKQVLGVVFASAILRAITFLERNWTRFCYDIRSAQLDFIIDPSCCSAMSDYLASQNPDLADEIEAICDRGCWKGILGQLWPRANYVEVVVMGSMSQYIPALEFYTDGKLPLPAPYVAYTLLPNMVYFEFIELENGAQSDDQDEEVSKDRLVSFVNVNVGRYYELVATTFTGKPSTLVTGA
ncbi:putative indole-3-acetic acid-amido synthetase GH3.9 [Aristolochia californica]|uniref:putative indole-3-acetic acid-amido synthetase GH3.9 n=1 Tax=Aristolochia californica TaxID=171875 RepID=UPI0035DF06F0